MKFTWECIEMSGVFMNDSNIPVDKVTFNKEDNMKGIIRKLKELKRWNAFRGDINFMRVILFWESITHLFVPLIRLWKYKVHVF